MAITIQNSFITQFSADVKQDYALMSRLDPVVNKRRVTGTDTKFQRLGSGGTAYTKTRNADLTVQEPAHSQVTVTLTDYYSSNLADDLDLLKTNVDIKREYVKLVAKSLARAQDSVILTALGLASNTATTNTGAMSIARLLEIKKFFDNNSVDPDGRVMVLGSAAMEDLLGTTQASSTDFNTVKALVQGDLDTFVGFKFVTVPDSYLPAVTTTRTCYAFHKDALGVAVGQDPKTFIEWSPDKHAWWVKGTLSMGAGIIDNAGVIKFNVDQ